MKAISKRFLLGAGLGLFLLLLIQLIPYGKEHVNPPVLSEPGWDTPQTRQLAQRACFDCHSNETVWPWYSRLAPVSWLLWWDVQEGRDNMNFSAWNESGSQDLQEILEVLQEGEMPPFQYLLLHPEARLTQSEKQALLDGLRNSIP